MAGTLRVCVAQINFQSGHIRAHVERMRAIIREFRDYDLIVFPELILQGHPSVEQPEGLLYRKARVVYSTISGAMYRYIQDVSARVIFGEMRRRGDYLYNVASYVDHRGVQQYTKTHVHWTENFVPGSQLQVFDTPVGAVGINICYDSAFQEVWRVAALAGAEIIVNISAAPASFPAHYMTRRMQAAALNNQVFVVFANRAGPSFSGNSAVFDPRGDVVRQAGSAEAVFTAEIDLAQVREWRQQEILYAHRRPRLYRGVCRAMPQTFVPPSTRQRAPLPGRLLLDEAIADGHVFAGADDDSSVSR